MGTADDPHIANPYASPRELLDEQAPLDRSEAWAERLDFHADWSIAGLRLRRKRLHHLLLNWMFVTVTILGLGVFLLQSINVSPLNYGLCCFVGYVWFFFLMLMLPTWTYQQADSFSQNAPGWVGSVHARIERGYCCVIGPKMSVTIRGVDCSRWRWERGHVDFRIPSINETLSLFNSDLTLRERSTPLSTEGLADEMDCSARSALVRHAAAMIDQMGFRRSHLISSSVKPNGWYFVEGKLSGKCFCGTRRYRFWKASCVVTAVISALSLIWTLCEFQQLPPWVIDPPAHYVQSDSDQSAMMSALFATLITIALLVTCFWNFVKLRRRFGDYAVALSSEMVLLATDKVCHGYHQQGLHHFQWTAQGLAVCAVDWIEPTFLIPLDWMDQDTIRFCQGRFTIEQQSLARASDSNGTQRVYIFPKI